MVSSLISRLVYEKDVNGVVAEHRRKGLGKHVALARTAKPIGAVMLILTKPISEPSNVRIYSSEIIYFQPQELHLVLEGISPEWSTKSSRDLAPTT